ncbi:TIGR01777 family oxidoreductase [Peribacillus deserti]|uniref:TIGR01777 family protein n=1 Tax=Peribacillus deserti TaxID=673318 RepID=A0A2N5MC10_9BACI|nr:TIGR01777 family oxidoreductase [Peribacillus deserti]PLT31873.1 TIGR01777 family protein [Peribacillus deserti]
MNIVLAGGTGFVGSQLMRLLVNEGHQLYILTRNPHRYKEEKSVVYIQWLSGPNRPEFSLPQIHAIINLSGESLNAGRWTPQQKNKILASRISTTREINRLISFMKKKPDVLINASAIGFYGTSLDNTFDESTTEAGSDFLAQTVYQWESEALKAEQFKVRTVLARFGIVLGKDAGALPKMLLPYKLLFGGKIGSGKQWMSWIHAEDAARALLFLLLHNDISGPVNLTAPNPVRMDEFGRTIGKALKRPHWLPVPSVALKLGLGEMSMLVLEGQKAVPEKLLSKHFTYRFPELMQALCEILKK